MRDGIARLLTSTRWRLRALGLQILILWILVVRLEPSVWPLALLAVAATVLAAMTPRRRPRTP